VEIALRSVAASSDFDLERWGHQLSVDRDTELCLARRAISHSAPPNHRGRIAHGDVDTIGRTTSLVLVKVDDVGSQPDRFDVLGRIGRIHAVKDVDFRRHRSDEPELDERGRRRGRRGANRRVDAGALSIATVCRQGVVIVAVHRRADTPLRRGAGIDCAGQIVVAVLVDCPACACDTVAGHERAKVAVPFAVRVLRTAIWLVFCDTLARDSVPAEAVTKIFCPCFAVVTNLVDEKTGTSFEIAPIHSAQIAIFADDWCIGTTLGLITRVDRAWVVVVAVGHRANLARAARAHLLRAGVVVVAGRIVDALITHATEAEIVRAGIVVVAVDRRALAGAGRARVLERTGIAVVAVARGVRMTALALLTEIHRAQVVVVAIGLGDALRLWAGVRRDFLLRDLDLLHFLHGGVGAGVAGVDRRDLSLLSGVRGVTRVRRRHVRATVGDVRGVGVFEPITAADHQRDQHRDAARDQLDVLALHDDPP